MNQGYKGVRGCVTASDPEQAGFTKHRFTARSIDECADIARKGGIMCEGGNCSYFAFTSRTIDDKLREAKNQNDNGNPQVAILYLQQAWKSLDQSARKAEMLKAEKLPASFLNGFGAWAAKNPEILQRLRDGINDSVMPLPLEGNCYVGGGNIVNDPHNKNNPNPHIVLSDEMGGFTSAASCKYDLFELPPSGTLGANVQQKMINMYKRRVARQKKQVEEIKKKLEKDQIALRVAQKHTRPEEMIAEVVAIEKDMKIQEKQKPYINALTETKESLHKSLEGAKLFNYVAKTTNSAVESSNKLLNAKKNVLHKLDADIDNLSWSLQKTSDQEHLQNKITTTLGILVVLFVALCIALLIYYLLYRDYSVSVKSGKSDANIFSSVFDTKKPKGGIPGSYSNKSAINNIFSFST